MTSSTSLSAPLVFTWKNEGAETRILSAPTTSPQEPRPARRSWPAILRALAGPFCITRVTEVGLQASARTFATAARGKPPGRSHRATSTSRVRVETRTPTRSRSRWWELAM